MERGGRSSWLGRMHGRVRRQVSGEGAPAATGVCTVGWGRWEPDTRLHGGGVAGVE